MNKIKAYFKGVLDRFREVREDRGREKELRIKLNAAKASHDILAEQVFKQNLYIRRLEEDNSKLFNHNTRLIREIESTRGTIHFLIEENKRLTARNYEITSLNGDMMVYLDSLDK